MALTAGIERTDEFRVEGDLLTDVDATLPTPVLATPAVISMMEYAAARLVRDELPAGHATVGFEVCVKHVGGALEGATCTVSARLRELIDERKLRFDVEVREGERTIGFGRHERRVVQVSRTLIRRRSSASGAPAGSAAAATRLGCCGRWSDQPVGSIASAAIAPVEESEAPLRPSGSRWRR